jgi:ATP-dependent 26S proteasome regulatory subunit
MDEIINEIKEIISNPLYHFEAYKQLNILPI